MISRKYILFPILVILAVSCQKNSVDEPFSLSYGDSIFYIKSQEYSIYPAQSSAGTYAAFPEDGIRLDKTTGEIRVKGNDDNIFTGLKYRITHTAPNGDTSSTVILISGITYFDKFYHLSQGDSIASPVYNGNSANTIPLNGSSFDDNNLANSSGCSVKTTNGQINLAQTVRNGLFGTTPQNDTRHDIRIEYKLNDASGKAQNKLDVRLYYYNTMADVATDLLETLNDRQSQGVFLGMNNSTLVDLPVFRSLNREAIAKPRPPCVIIIGQ